MGELKFRFNFRCTGVSLFEEIPAITCRISNSYFARYFFLFVFTLCLTSSSLAQTSCDDSGVPAFNPRNCTNGNFIGANIATRDPGENFLATVIVNDSGGGGILLAEDGTEYCDENGAFGADPEGPDLRIQIPVPANKRNSCSAATLTITLRGDFNNSCEVAYIVNECDVIIAQSQVTGLPENNKCDVVFPLSVNIPAADMAEAAADGLIEFQIRTPSFNPNCCQGSDVDATCGPGNVDCNGNGVADGNCLALSSLEWPITNDVFAGTLNSTNEIVCPGETVEIDVLQDLLFTDPVGLGDGDDNTGTYHLDFYYGGGPNPPNPYNVNLGGTAGDVVNAYTVNGPAQNPQVDIMNVNGTGIQDHSNTNAPLTSGGGNLPSNTLIEVVGSVWVDNNQEPSAAGFCTGAIIGCTYTTSYVSFVLLEPITANATCLPCAAGPGDDTNTGVVQLSGFNGGLPAYDDTEYTLQATGGTLSSTMVDVNGNVMLTLDQGTHSWSVTVMDEEGCEYFLNGNCGISEDPEIVMPSFSCVDGGPIPVSVNPTGGTLSGPGISGSTFNPVVAGPGTHIIRYTYTVDNCTVIDEHAVLVDACSGCSDLATSITCNINYVTQNNNLNIDDETTYNTLDDGPGGKCGRPIGTTDLCLFNVFVEKCGKIDLIAKFTDSTLSPNDIDAYVWGPFDNLPSEINELTPANNLVCDPDVATTEGTPFTIECAVVGKFYVVGVADFTGDGGGNNVFIGQTNTSEAGAGAILGCTVPDPILTADDVSVCQGEPISVTVRADNVPFTCEGTLNIYEDAMGTTLVGESGVATLSAGCYDYFVACVPDDASCACELDYIAVKIFVDDLVTIPMAMDINDGCGDYDEVINNSRIFDIAALFPNADEGGTLSVSIINDPSGVATAVAVANDQIKTTGPGCFEITYAIDASQCGGPNEESIFIQRNFQPEPNFTIQDQICLPGDSETNSVVLTPIINSPGSAYDALVSRSWSVMSTASGANFINLSTGQIEFDAPGTYVVRLTETVNYAMCGPFDNGACTAFHDVEIIVQDGTLQDASFMANLSTCPDTDVALTPTTNGGVFSGLGVTDNGLGTGGVFNSSNSGEHVVTYTITTTNGCTNSYSLIIRVDEVPPVITTCPSDLELECGNASNTTSINTWLETFSATDDCGDVTTSNALIETITLCGNTEYRTYEFTAEDENGNISTCLANVIIEDTTAPEITVPADITLSCGTLESTSGVGPANITEWLSAVSATDACGNVTIVNDYVSNGFDITCGDAGTQTINFIATDECGNTSSETAIVTIVDDTAPTIICPADIELECGDTNNEAIVQAWLTSAHATDECGDVTITNNYISLPSCGMDLTVTFTVVGNCDAISTTCTATISIVDNEKPLVMTPPQNLYLECDGSADPGSGIATWLGTNGGMSVFDSCDPNPSIVASVVTDESTCQGHREIQYLFTATDACGNLSVSEVATVFINDTTIPNVVFPMNATVNCNENPDPLAWANSFSATDACGDVEEHVNLISIVDQCNMSNTVTVHTYTFYAVDDCGNQSALATRTYTIQDVSNPTITSPANLSLDCTDNMEASILAWLDDYTIVDNCNASTELTVTNNFVSLPDICGGNTVVTWTVTDACGASNTSTAQIIVSNDITLPTVSCPSDLVLQCADSNNAALIENWLSLASATDNCATPVSISHNYTGTLSDMCGTTGMFTVTFTATDGCGNTNTCQADIIIEDNEDPVFTLLPQDLTLDCGDANNNDLITDWVESNGGAIASDDCSDTALSWSSSFTTSDGCGNSEIRNVVFTVTDNCGNTETASADIIIQDTTDPILTPPVDETHECGDVSKTLTDWLADASATDECGTATVTNVLWNTISGCGATEEVEYLFTATDECGNTATGFATYTLVDRELPVFAPMPMNLTLECGADNNESLIQNWLDSFTATDLNSCDTDVVVTHDFDGNLPMVLDCDGGAGVMVSFTAIDDCGNSSMTMGSISLNDTQDPVFLNCPSDITLNVSDDNCNQEIVFSTPVATDNCDNVVSVSLLTSLGSGDEFPVGTTTVTFEAIDECDNTATCSFDVTIVDSDAPSLQCPIADVDVCTDFGSCTWLATDQINPVTPESCAGFVVTYDITNPDNSITTSTNTMGVATPEGDAVLFALGTSTVVYTVTDVNGNTTTCSFDVVVNDCEVPTITCSDFTIACGSEDLDTWQATIAATTTDNCSMDGAMTVTRTLITDFSSCGNTIDQVYVFTVTDDAGNSASCLGRYTTTDTDPPIINNAVNETVECDPGVTGAALLAWLQNNGGATLASDNCSTDVVWTNDYTGSLNAGCGGTGSTTVTFTATDECGNTATTQADFIITDSTDPVFSCPENLTLECGDEDNEVIINAWLAQANASDNCSVSVTAANNYDALGYTTVCGNARNQTVTFTFTDGCGNIETCDRTITIQDTTNPTIEVGASDIILECAVDNTVAIDNWESIFGGAQASDECSPNALTWSIASTTETTSCGNTTSTLYVFEVEDNCGNTSTTSASLIIEDTTPPSLTVPEPQTAAAAEECGNIVVDLATWQSEAIHSDLCGSTTIEVVLWNSISKCGNTNEEVYLFTVTDECGNTSTGLSSYEITDNEPPILTCVAPNLVLECGDEDNLDLIYSWLSTATSLDTYGCNDVVIENDFNGGLPALDCDALTGKLVTFTATDACGNASTCQGTIIIDDTSNPSFVNFPDDMTVYVDVDNCSRNIVFSTPVGFDACDESPAVNLESAIASGEEFPLGTSTVTFSATDDCGNSIEDSFEITVLDSDTPVIECPSNDVVVCTDPDACTWEATDVTDPSFGDNCMGATVSYSYTNPDGSIVNSSVVTGMVFTVEGDSRVFALGTTNIRYMIVDASGNITTCTFNVVVEDCQSPTITCTDELNVACGSEDIADWVADIALSTTDNCSTDGAMIVDVLLLTDVSSCGNTFDQTYLFTVSDEAGNTATCTARYMTEDLVSPVITTEAEDLVLGCGDEDRSQKIQNWLNQNGLAQATDACSLPLSWTNDYTGNFTNSCGNVGSSIITFTVEDDCGRSSTTQANIVVEDQSPPTITCPFNLTLECNNPNNATILAQWLASATAQDDCSEVTVSNNFMSLPTCGNSIDVVFTVEGNCDGETVQCTSQITVIDNVKPVVMTPPQDLIVECDGTGNISQINAWLSSNTENNAAQGMSAVDNCTAVSITVEETMRTDECGETTTISFAFTASDECGNSITQVAKVFIVDNTPPVLTLPTATNSVSCEGDVEGVFNTWLASASASNTCGGAEVNYALVEQRKFCLGNSTIEEWEYIFFAEDDCGFTTNDNAVFTVVDDIDPIIIAPENLELSCGEEIGAQVIVWLMNYTVTDNCQSYEVTNNFDGIVPDLCGGSELITWTVVDECGASATATASIIVEDDTEAPLVDYCPEDIVFTTEFGQCDAVVNYGTPTASDCNGPITITKTSGPDVGSMLVAGTTETVVFTIADHCGNETTCEFDLTVLDQQLPEIDCPSTDVEHCADLGICTWTSDSSVAPISFSDNCEGAMVSYTISGATTANGSDDATGQIFNLGTSLVTYTIVDANGNDAVSCSFNVVVSDCESPEITCSDELNVLCGDEDVSSWFNTIAMTATDNCDAQAVLDVDTLLLTDLSSCGETFERTYLYTVTDLAGNTSTCTATYMTVDNMDPAIDTEAQNLTIECDGSNQSVLLQGWLNGNAGATASDNCGDNVSWSNDFTGAVNSICAGTSEIEVTFTVTDECANTNETTATFRIEDTTPPVLMVPENLVLDCGDPFNPFFITIWMNGASAIDACNGIAVVTNSIVLVEEECGLTNTTHYEFATEDDCGNRTALTRTVTIVDNEDPEIDTPAEDLVVECGAVADVEAWLISNGGASANDNCSDEELTWSYEESVTANGCGGTGTTTYIFTVEDNCGNTSTTAASLVIVDTTSPVLNEPDPIVEECNNIAVTVSQWLATASATDVCGTAAVTYVLWDTNLGCGSTFYERYLFTATDECGNTSTAFSDYQTLDQSAPFITCPESLVLECGNSDNAVALQSWLQSASASDRFDCSEVILSYEAPMTLPDLSCDMSESLGVVFTATDECGNTSSCEAQIFMVDTTDPVFLNCPEDLIVNVDVDLCGANPIFSAPVADDNCEVQVSQTSGLPSGSEFPVGETIIEYLAVDDCGNTAICQFTITVIDSDVPTILCPSNIVEVNTDVGQCTWVSDDQVNPSLSIENCPNQTIDYTISGATVSSGSGNVEGETFQLGLSTVCYTITDPSNNSASCCFDVLVVDEELPEIVCPNDTTLIATDEVNGICVASFEWTHPEPTDNCGIAQLDAQIMAPSWDVTTFDDVVPGASQTESFDAGFSYVSYVVTDENGNTNTCEFKVEVIGIKHEKTIQRITQNPDDSYCTEYNIRVWNTGNNVGRYSLWDIPAFDDDFVILSAEYSSSVHSLTPLPTTIPADGWQLGNQELIAGFGSHTYILTVCTIVDLKDPDTPGDAMYTKCGNIQTPPVGLAPGQALFNESLLDVNQDNIPDARDTVCGDIPYITHEKEFLGYTRNADRTYDAQFKITVSNVGGDLGAYDLWDIPYFDDDFVINEVSYTSDIDDGNGGVFGGIVPGPDQYILADDQVLDYDSTHCYFVNFNVSINLSDPETVGDELYVWCGTTDPNGVPQKGEGLYNESYLDRSNDGTPEEIEFDCGDIEIVDLALRKTLETPEPYMYGQVLDFEIEIFNQGNIDLYNIEINDYMPVGYTFDVALNDPLWSQVSPGLLEYNELGGPLAPASSQTLNLKLRLEQTTGGYKDWDNYAEINYMEDVNGVDKSGEDVDSTPDSDDSNDNPVMVGDAEDDVITEGGPYFGEDEDDHDPAGPYIFDLALRKLHDQAASQYVYGGLQYFDIEVFNQGNEDATNIVVTDTLPCGLIFESGNAVNVAEGWTFDIGTNEISVVYGGVLQPGDMISIPLVLRLESCLAQEAYVNYAEIESADDLDPTTTGEPVDIDSQSDDDNTNDIGGTPNDPNQDNVISDPGIIDEDDHDPEEVQIFDLALRKTVPSTGPYNAGDIVEFEIELFNQGTVDAYNIEITDYLNTGYLFNAGGINAGWYTVGSNAAYNYSGPLAAGDSTTISLYLEIVIPGGLDLSVWVNEAEISRADDNNDPTDGFAQDIDSTLDNDPDNDNDVVPGGPDDNVIDEHAIPNGDDEDDNDVADVIVVGQLCGVVWNDCNGDGIRNEFGAGMEGITVDAFTEDGVYVGSDVTDSNGFYLINNLTPGSYYVIVNKPEDYLFTEFREGVFLHLDSDINEFHGINSSQVASIGGGPCDPGDFDAGLYKCIPIGERVWYDINENDVFDGFENGINGLPVNLWRLKNGTWELYETILTGHKPGTPSDDGYFKFCAPPGTYEIRVDLPGYGLVPAVKDVGPNANLAITSPGESLLDSDLTFDQRTGAFTIDCSFTELCNIGGGYYPQAMIGNRVWEDSNQDGLQSTGENGIQGVTVQAFDTNGQMINSDVTDANGSYMIDYLGKNEYYLKFSPPNTQNFIITTPNTGNEQMDSDVDGSNGFNTTASYSLNPGDEIPYVDAGFYIGVVVPVEFLEFTVRNIENFNQLDWSTASEVNSSHFDIERSINNTTDFVQIGKVIAAGNSSTVETYDARDYDIEQGGTYYYRLKQVDLNGEFSYSKTISIRIEGEPKDGLELYPNPAVDEVNLDIEMSREDLVNVSIWDASGKMLRGGLINRSLGIGSHTEKLNVTDLPAGMYTLVVKIGDTGYNKKLVVIDGQEDDDDDE